MPVRPVHAGGADVQADAHADRRRPGRQPHPESDCRSTLTPTPRLRWLSARTPYLALAVGTIALGLAVHRHGSVLSPVVRDVLGDALWAAMVAWWIAAAAPAMGLRWRASAALAVCCAVELSQRYHAPALDALRRTTVGQLVLGSGFDSRDLAAYAAGVLAAVLLERAATRRRSTGLPGLDGSSTTDDGSGPSGSTRP